MGVVDVLGRVLRLNRSHLVSSDPAPARPVAGRRDFAHLPIIVGLLFATVLTLGLVRVLYALAFRVSFKAFSY